MGFTDMTNNKPVPAWVRGEAQQQPFLQGCLCGWDYCGSPSPPPSLKPSSYHLPLTSSSICNDKHPLKQFHIQYINASTGKLIIIIPSFTSIWAQILVIYQFQWIDISFQILNIRYLSKLLIKSIANTQEVHYPMVVLKKKSLFTTCLHPSENKSSTQINNLEGLDLLGGWRGEGYRPIWHDFTRQGYHDDEIHWWKQTPLSQKPLIQ